MAEAASTTEVEYTLYLSQEEAQLVADVLANVAGHPDTTRRVHADSVRTALGEVGVKHAGPVPPRDFTGRIVFHDGDVFSCKDRAYTFVKDWSTV